jgi:4-amino-4-deoxy-L-arabinose transferase-like glycosyltransferase
MSTIQRYANLGAVVVPFLALLLAIVLLWNRAVGAIELSIMVFMYCLTGLGITVVKSSDVV